MKILLIEANLNSFLLYCVVFGFSILLANNLQKYKSSIYEIFNPYINKSLIDFIIVTLIVILPAIFIGTRADFVGADTKNNIVNYIRTNGVFNVGNVREFRYIFHLLNVITFKISNGNTEFFLFTVAFITLFLYTFTLYSFEDDKSLGIGLFAYFFLISIQTFNQSRQLLAVSIVFFGVKYLIKKENWRYVVVIIIASLVHITALVALFFPILLFVNKRIINRKIYYALIILTPFIIPLLLRTVVLVTPSEYKHYLLNLRMSKIGFGFILSITPVLLFLILYKNDIAKVENLDLFMNISLLTIPFRYSGYYSYFLMRLQYYSLMFIPLALSLAFSHNTINKKRNTLILFTIIILHFFIINVYLNDSKIFPYASAFSFD